MDTRNSGNSPPQDPPLLPEAQTGRLNSMIINLEPALTPNISDEYQGMWVNDKDKRRTNCTSDAAALEDTSDWDSIKHDLTKPENSYSLHDNNVNIYTKTHVRGGGQCGYYSFMFGFYHNVVTGKQQLSDNNHKKLWNAIMTQGVYPTFPDKELKSDERGRGPIISFGADNVPHGIVFPKEAVQEFKNLMIEHEKAKGDGKNQSLIDRLNPNKTDAKGRCNEDGQLLSEGIDTLFEMYKIPIFTWICRGDATGFSGWMFCGGVSPIIIKKLVEENYPDLNIISSFDFYKTRVAYNGGYTPQYPILLIGAAGHYDNLLPYKKKPFFTTKPIASPNFFVKKGGERESTTAVPAGTTNVEFNKLSEESKKKINGYYGVENLRQPQIDNVNSILQISNGNVKTALGLIRYQENIPDPQSGHLNFTRYKFDTAQPVPMSFIGEFKPDLLQTSIQGYARDNSNALVLYSANSSNSGPCRWEEEKEECSRRSTDGQGQAEDVHKIKNTFGLFAGPLSTVKDAFDRIKTSLVEAANYFNRNRETYTHIAMPGTKENMGFYAGIWKETLQNIGIDPSEYRYYNMKENDKQTEVNTLLNNLLSRYISNAEEAVAAAARAPVARNAPAATAAAAAAPAAPPTTTAAPAPAVAAPAPAPAAGSAPAAAEAAGSAAAAAAAAAEAAGSAAAGSAVEQPSAEKPPPTDGVDPLVQPKSDKFVEKHMGPTKEMLYISYIEAPPQILIDGKLDTIDEYKSVLYNEIKTVGIEIKQMTTYDMKSKKAVAAGAISKISFGIIGSDAKYEQIDIDKATKMKTNQILDSLLMFAQEKKKFPKTELDKQELEVHLLNKIKTLYSKSGSITGKNTLLTGRNTPEELELYRKIFPASKYDETLETKAKNVLNIILAKDRDFIEFPRGLYSTAPMMTNRDSKIDKTKKTGVGASAKNLAGNAIGDFKNIASSASGRNSEIEQKMKGIPRIVCIIYNLYQPVTASTNKVISSSGPENLPILYNLKTDCIDARGAKSKELLKSVYDYAYRHHISNKFTQLNNAKVIFDKIKKGAQDGDKDALKIMTSFGGYNQQFVDKFAKICNKTRGLSTLGSDRLDTTARKTAAKKEKCDMAKAHAVKAKKDNAGIKVFLEKLQKEIEKELKHTLADE